MFHLSHMPLVLFLQMEYLEFRLIISMLLCALSVNIRTNRVAWIYKWVMELPHMLHFLVNFSIIAGLLLLMDKERRLVMVIILS